MHIEMMKPTSDFMHMILSWFWMVFFASAQNNEVGCHPSAPKCCSPDGLGMYLHA